jgi:hypothetical protein
MLLDLVLEVVEHVFELRDHPERGEVNIDGDRLAWSVRCRKSSPAAWSVALSH